MTLPGLGQITPEEVAACGPAEEAGTVCRVIFRVTDNELIASLSDTFIVKPLRVVLILALAILFNAIIHRVIKRFVSGLRGEGVRRRFKGVRETDPSEPFAAVPTLRASQRADTIGALLRSIASFAVWGVALMMALGEIGINLGPLIAGAGIVGVALGFGAQNLVKDFLSGIFMLIEDQYGVGDVIDAGDATGTVEAVTLRTTRLRDVHGVVWHIPNGSISRIGNKSQQWSRALLDVEVAYGTDLDTATDVIRNTAVEMAVEGEWRTIILEEPEVWGVESLGANGVAIRLVVKTLPSEQWKTARELRRRIKLAFDRAGIEIPFPQQTVWHRADQGVHFNVSTDAEPEADAGKSGTGET